MKWLGLGRPKLFLCQLNQVKRKKFLSIHQNKSSISQNENLDNKRRKKNKHFPKSIKNQYSSDHMIVVKAVHSRSILQTSTFQFYVHTRKFLLSPPMKLVPNCRMWSFNKFCIIGGSRQNKQDRFMKSFACDVRTTQVRSCCMGLCIQSHR